MAHFKTKHPHKKRSELSTLMLLSVLTLGILGSMMVTNIFSFSSFSKTNAVSLGGVELGSSLDSFRDQQPQATSDLTRFGSLTMTFADLDSAYRIWYGEDGQNTVAYKARQSRVIDGISEDEFVGQLSMEYGPPSLSSCSRRVMDGIRDCHFSWWVPDNVRIDLNSRQIKKSSGPQIQITLQITDTRMNMRLQQQSARKGTSVSMF
ncbi:MAG: hypothetical protein JKY92_02070 [Magnetovibrio sp.]|nr:hypothetical protein [Magnetovibrio sp.]